MKTSKTKARELYAHMMDSDEQPPPPKTLVIGFSNVYKNYYMCQFSTSMGWRDQLGNKLSHISHWVDTNLNLFPFDHTEDVDKSLGIKLGLFVKEQ